MRYVWIAVLGAAAWGWSGSAAAQPVCGDSICDPAWEDCAVCAEDCGCDDGNPCTSDGCDFVTGCFHAPSTASCSDGDPCTVGDACSGGACASGPPRICPEDGNPCTVDACDPASGECGVRRAVGTPCDDGSVCTSTSSCDAAGACTGSVDITCTPDTAPCSDTVCDPVLGCTTRPKPDGAACDPPGDMDVCTENDRCFGGACGGDAVVCVPDLNPCTSDTCMGPTAGCYVPEPTGTSCDDADPCTTGDRCAAGGVCTGDVVGCPVDSNPCTDDICHPVTGLCGHYPKPDGAACAPPGDVDACTAPDECRDVGGVPTCVGIMSVDCSDADRCTVDSCDPATGCANALECPCVDDAPPAWSVASMLSLDYQVRCPVFGGDVGAELELSGEASGSPPTCDSGCVGSSGGSIEGNLTMGFCRGLLDEWSVGASLSTRTVRNHCEPCDRGTCTASCDEAAYCQERTTMVGASFGVSKSFGWEWGWERIWGLDISVALQCNVTVSTAIRFSGTDLLREDHGACMPCTDCESTDVGAMLPIDAVAGCGVTASIWDRPVELGCRECARIGIAFSGNVMKPCGEARCTSASVRGGFAYTTPSIAVSLPWIGGIDMGCHGEKWMTCRASSGGACGDTGCDPAEGELLDCHAEASGLLASALEAAGVEL